MNYKGVKDRMYTCETCAKGFSKIGYPWKGLAPKFCSMECQMAERWKQTISRIESGEVTNSRSQRMYLSEKFGYKCSECGCNEWNHKPLVLQVDHKDGDPGNNYPSNLRLMCPNCHSQTLTYKGGNKKAPKLDDRSQYHREHYKKSGARSRDRT